MLSVAYKNSVGARRTAWRTISAIQSKEEYKVGILLKGEGELTIFIFCIGVKIY